MIKQFLYVLVLAAVVLSSCGDDDTPEKVVYNDGVVIVNQGPFMTGSGSLTYMERGNSVPVQNIFSVSNDGAVLGNIAQSMIEHNGKNFISINNGGKVVVTENDNFTFIDTITNINQGRYFASNGSKLYLSSWGDTGSNGGVFEINSSSNSVEDYIELGNGPEGLVFVDDLLYIAKGGGFLRDSVVLIMDTDDNSILKSIVVGDNPSLMVKDNDDNVYVICNGYTDWNDPANSTPGKIVKIANQEIVFTKDISGGFTYALAIDADNGFIYYLDAGQVIKESLNFDSSERKVIKDITASALGFDADEDKLYIADGKDNQSQGEIYVFSKNDVEIDSFAAGIIPGFFHFK